MNIEIATADYNPRRYSTPWVAKVEFRGTKPHYEFGSWIGSPGERGILIIDASPGDIIAAGQKDYRGGRNSTNKWYLVRPDGGLDAISRVEAYKFAEKKRESENAHSDSN